MTESLKGGTDIGLVGVRMAKAIEIPLDVDRKNQMTVVSEEETVCDPEFDEFEDPAVRLFLTKRKLRRPKSLKNFPVVIRQYQESLGVPVSEATYSDVEDFADSLANRGLSQGTISVYLSVIRSMNKWLNNRYQLNLPLFTELDGSCYTNAPARKKPKPLTVDETVAMFEATALGDDPIRDALIVGLYYYHGLRLSEVINILLESVDIENKTFEASILKKNRVVTKKFRYHDDLVWLFDIWVTEARSRYTYAPSSEYLLVSRRSPQFSPGGLQTVLYDTAERAGIQRVIGKRADGSNKYRFHTHVLRHTFAQHANDHGIKTLELMHLMSHTRIETTMDYLEGDEALTDAERVYLERFGSIDST